MLAEIVISGLIAPVMMLIQSASVVQIVSGRDSGWQAQRRDDGSLPLAATMRRYGWHTAFGLLLALAAYEVSFSLFAWMTPVIVGLILAIPLAQWSASPAAGRRMRRHKLLLTPEETRTAADSGTRQRACASDPPAQIRATRSSGCSPTRPCSPHIARCCRRAPHASAVRSTPRL